MSKNPQQSFQRDQKIGLLMEVGRYREALAELGTALSAQPDNYNALCQKALCHYNLKEFQPGLDAAKLAIAASPEREWAFRLQSLIFTANGEHKRALYAAELCIQKAPYSFETRHTLFYAQANYGLLVEARETLKTVLELAPGTAKSHIASGYLSLKEKDLTAAEASYLQALKLDPESINALNNLGVVYLDMANAGRGEKYRQLSVEMFERAVKMQPTFKLAQTNVKAAGKRSPGQKRAAGFFALGVLMLSSPLQTILYLGFSDQISSPISLIDIFSPFRGDLPIIILNLITIMVVLEFAGIGLWYYLIKDKTRIPDVIAKAGFWRLGFAAALGFITLYLLLMFSANTDINSFPGMAVRSWFILLIVSGVNLSTLRSLRSV